MILKTEAHRFFARSHHNVTDLFSKFWRDTNLSSEVQRRGVAHKKVVVNSAIRVPDLHVCRTFGMTQLHNLVVNIPRCAELYISR